MNVDSNSYTFGFATMMVVIVAALLSYAAIELKPLQDTNIELEKQQNILSSIGVDVQRDLAKEVYSKYIKQEIVLNYKGEEVDGDAFEIELKKELKKANSDQALPLFISNVDGFKQYIIPLRGKGLWGPIWGFIALEEDLNTVYGAVFDHKGETPGLGAEINQLFFQEPFIGKTIFEDEEFTGQQYVTDTGPIDILAISKDKKTLLVVELKKGRVSDNVVGQIQRYMGFVKDDLAEKNQNVKGVIIGHDDDIRIQRALSVTNNIDFFKYQVNFKLYQ